VYMVHRRRLCIPSGGALISYLCLTRSEEKAAASFAQYLDIPFIKTKRTYSAKIACLWALMEKDDEWFSSENFATLAGSHVQRHSLSSTRAGQFLGMMNRCGYLASDKETTKCRVWKVSKQFKQMKSIWDSEYE
jgi:hypothetical protein